MFESIAMAPSDPILGITEDFEKDPNPRKINLSIGVFKDEHGNIPLLPSVKEAESRILKNEATKNYSEIEGYPAFTQAVIRLILGEDHDLIRSKRVVAAHTPGGSGALRLVGEFIHKLFPDTAIWICDPTWTNHLNIFTAAGLSVNRYPYFDTNTNGLAFGKMMEVFQKIPSGDTILFHGCCHNPSGVDPTLEQWQQIADLLHERGIIPIIDLAYQGFGDGLREDAAGLLALVRLSREAFICSSYSKNFALYNERTGCLTAIARNQKTAEIVMSQLKAVIRSMYSTPPAHGSIIVSTILNDQELRQQWQQELTQMRERIIAMRRLLAATLTAKGLAGDTSHFMKQKGMFSLSGLNIDQVQRLRDEHSVYIVGNGRINVAGLTLPNIGHLCDAIVKLSSAPLTSKVTSALNTIAI